jgi:polyadenylate-binding protein 2
LQGFAYIEFLEADAVDNAIMLDNSELRGRQIKVRTCSAYHSSMFL